MKQLRLGSAKLFLLCFLSIGLILQAGVHCGDLSTENGSNSPSGAGEEAETFQFQAEVSRLMDILINSLYSNKDIFLRELISNAADALDKFRLLSLTDQGQLQTGDELKIEIKYDKIANVLSIRDTGVGMTRQELVDNLGTIAKSGTSAFLEKMQKGGDVNLIGQFGVGFYSVFLVADEVEVISKNNNDDRFVWRSKADGNFMVYRDTETPDLKRGTLIKLHLKEETMEYSSDTVLDELVHKYSEFINFPIYLYKIKQSEHVNTNSVIGDVEDDSIQDDFDDETEELKNTVEKKIEWAYELINDNKPIWLRPQSEVLPDEYNKFFRSFAKSEYDPLSILHFKGEGDVEFKCLVFIPPNQTGEIDSYYTPKEGLDLYVRRVFIANLVDGLLPNYLGFLKGLVDSDTLPLSVSREVLQEHSSLKVIKKKITRKLLDELKRLASVDEEEDHPERGRFAQFWNAFGKNVKMGVIDDSNNRVRLARLLRFKTSKSRDSFTSLEEYVERMQPGQKKIYFIVGDENDAGAYDRLMESPYLEKLIAKDYEVILFTEPLDEYMMRHLNEFDDYSFQDAAKEKLSLGGKSENEKELKAEFKSFIKWWRHLLGAEVNNIRISRRLAKSPAIVVAGEFGYSAHMEKIIKAQALSQNSANMLPSDRILEINPRHPLVLALKSKFEQDLDNLQTVTMARLIFEAALLEAGYSLQNVRDFNRRIYEVLAIVIENEEIVNEDLEFAPEELADEAIADDDHTEL